MLRSIERRRNLIEIRPLLSFSANFEKTRRSTNVALLGLSLMARDGAAVRPATIFPSAQFMPNSCCAVLNRAMIILFRRSKSCDPASYSAEHAGEVQVTMRSILFRKRDRANAMWFDQKAERKLESRN